VDKLVKSRATRWGKIDIDAMENFVESPTWVAIGISTDGAKTAFKDHIDSILASCSPLSSIIGFNQCVYDNNGINTASDFEKQHNEATLMIKGHGPDSQRTDNVG